MDNNLSLLQQAVKDADIFVREWMNDGDSVPLEVQKAMTDVAHLLYYAAEWPSEFTPECNFKSIYICLQAMYHFGRSHGE